MFMSLRASTRANTLKNSWVFTQTYKPTLNNTSITCKHRLLESRGFFAKGNILKQLCIECRIKQRFS